MKKIAIITFSVIFSIGCASAARQTANVNAASPNASDPMLVSSHSETADNSAQNSMIVPKSETKTKWKQSGTPIDVTAYNAEIAKAEKNLKAKPKDEAAKKALADAYTKRGVALTEARQYASALGDYRRAVKYDANNEEAKDGMEVILSIYNSMNRESPPEGEEPPPLPFGNQTSVEPSNSAEKIEFAPGATSAAVTGKLKNYQDSKNFSISVGQGQTLRTEQVKDDNSLKYVTVAISDPDGKLVGDSDASCNNRKEIKPTAAGDYHINVTECMKANEWSGEFKLKVSAE